MNSSTTTTFFDPAGSGAARLPAAATARRLARVGVGVALVLILATWTACRTPESAPRRTPGAVRLGTDPAVVPMTLARSVPIVVGRIGSAGPFRFVIDTSAGSAVVDPRVALAAELRPALDLQENGGPMQRGYVRVARLELEDDVTFEDFDAVVRPMARRSEVLGTQIDGVIGSSLLRDLRWTFDYGASRVIASRRTGALPDGRRVLRVTLAAGRPVLTATLGNWLINPMVDTGSPLSLELDSGDEPHVSFATAPRGSGTARDPRIGVVAGALRLGSIQIEQPEVVIAEGSAIGGAFLERYVVHLDLRQGARSFELQSP